MKANDPNALLARDANEAARAGLSYGAWRSLKDSQKLADKVHFRRAQQVAEIQRKRGEEEMKFKVSTTVATYEEVMAIVQALAGIVNNINVTDCEGEEDEDDV